MPTPAIDFDPYRAVDPTPQAGTGPRAGSTPAATPAGLDFNPYGDAASNDPAHAAGAAPRAPERTAGEVVDDAGYVIRRGTRNVVSGLLGLPVNALNLATAAPRNLARLSEAATDHQPAFLRDSALGRAARAVNETVANSAVQQPEFVRGMRDELHIQDQQDRAQWASDKLQQQEAAFAAQDGVVDSAKFLATNPSLTAMLAAEQLPQLLVRVKGSLPGTVGAQAALAGAQNADQVERTLREAGADEADIANRAANAFGVSAAINSVLPLALPGGAAAERVLAGQVGRTAGNVAVRAGKGVAGEGFNEALTEGLDQVTQNVASRRPWDEGVGQAAALGGAIGTVVGAPAGVLDARGHQQQQTAADPAQGNQQPLALPPPDRTAEHGVIHVGPNGEAIPDTQAVQSRHPGYARDGGLLRFENAILPEAAPDAVPTAMQVAMQRALDDAAAIRGEAAGMRERAQGPMARIGADVLDQQASAIEAQAAPVAGQLEAAAAIAPAGDVQAQPIIPESGLDDSPIPPRRLPGPDQYDQAEAYEYVQRNGEYQFGSETAAARYAAGLAAGEGGIWQATEVAPGRWRAVRQQDDAPGSSQNAAAARGEAIESPPTVGIRTGATGARGEDQGAGSSTDGGSTTSPDSTTLAALHRLAAGEKVVPVFGSLSLDDAKAVAKALGSNFARTRAGADPANIGRTLARKLGAQGLREKAEAMARAETSREDAAPGIRTLLTDEEQAELGQRAEEQEPRIRALTQEQATAALAAIGEDKAGARLDPWDALRRQHPDDVETALAAVAGDRGGSASSLFHQRWESPQPVGDLGGHASPALGTVPNAKLPEGAGTRTAPATEATGLQQVPAVNAQTLDFDAFNDAPDTPASILYGHRRTQAAAAANPAAKARAETRIARMFGEAASSSGQPAPVTFEPLGAKGLLLRGDTAAIRDQLRAAGYSKSGRVQNGALRFDAKDRPALERALGVAEQNAVGEPQHSAGLDFDPYADRSAAIANDGPGLRRDHAERLVQRFTKAMPNAPQVVLVDSAEELHRAAGVEATDDGARAEGLYNGKPAVFINTAAINSPKRFRQVLAHEVVGHFGVEQVVGDAWPHIAKTIEQHIEKGTGARWMREAIAQARASQPNVTDTQALAKEVVAVLAERGSKNSLLGTVIARTRATLRKAIPSVAWTDGDVRDVIARAEGFLHQRPPALPAVEEHPLRKDDAATYGNTRPLQAPPERGATAAAEPGASSGRGSGSAAVPAGLDVFLATGADGRRVAASQTRLLQSAKVVRTGDFRSGVAQVETLADAAHVLAPLRKSAQEKFLALALDAEGAPVAVLQHSVGTLTGSDVTPGTVLGAVAALPGIRSVVFAHNHPSGNPVPSSSDMALDRNMNQLFRGAGIEVKGSIILQPGRDTFTSYDGRGETGESRDRITPARRTGTVPVVERQLRKVLPEAARHNIGGPPEARRAVQALRAQNPAGVLLLNNQHDVVGHLPFDPIATETLRTGDVDTSHARFVKAAVEGNAASAILYGDALFARGINNLAAALRAADIRPIDLFTFEGDRSESWAEEGRSIGDGVFYSKPGEAPPDIAGVVPQFGHVNDRQREALGKIATHRPRETLGERAERLTRNLRARILQGTVDQFHAFRDLDEAAYMQARLSKGTDGTIEGVFRYGLPKLTDGALDIKGDGKGFLGHLQDLQGEHDLFLAWVAGHRSEQLAQEGREHLFTGDDIAALKQLNKGRMPDGRSREAVYRNALVQLNRYQAAVLDIAQEAGVINDTSRALWNSDFYVPFFRDMGGQPAAATHPTRAGDEPGDIAAMRKSVIEKLVGGGQPLNDLLENTLQNWGRLLSASMKNMAATRALNAAVDIGVAKPMPKAERGTVSAMFQGERKHFQVDDPLVLESLTMLYAPTWSNPAMKTLQWFKRALTTGVTADPTFRVRNLIRDTLSVLAANKIGFNPLQNLVQGWKATAHGSDTFLKLLGGGGAIRFGSVLDGDQAAHAKRLIEAGLAKDADILSTPAKAKAGLVRLWDAWQELGDRGETMNRAALYEQARAEGKTHLEASFAARDVMDFTNSGAWPAVQFLTRTVPFMNARLQGIYKLGRGAKQYPRRFAAVTGAVAMASVLLHLANKDDEDYRALPDWVRDTYWWVKVPGTGKALYIPKPFEIGALGSVAERGTELMTAGSDYDARDFARTLRSILSDQLAMNPIPQAVRPAMEAAFNWNSFLGRPIDSMGQERLPAADRYSARTSGGAVAFGRATGTSPNRIEHLARGYFGWLGVQALNVSDLMTRDLLNLGANPAHNFGKVDNIAVIGSFLKEREAGSSKYVQRFYDQQRQVEMLYAAYGAARQAGDLDRARELAGDDRLKLRGLYSAADTALSAVNRRIRQITNDRKMSAEAKGELLAGLYTQRNRIARNATTRARERQEQIREARP